MPSALIVRWTTASVAASVRFSGISPTSTRRRHELGSPNRARSAGNSGHLSYPPSMMSFMHSSVSLRQKPLVTPEEMTNAS
jgi:hypothetical protein